MIKVENDHKEWDAEIPIVDIGAHEYKALYLYGTCVIETPNSSTWANGEQVLVRIAKKVYRTRIQGYQEIVGEDARTRKMVFLHSIVN